MLPDLRLPSQFKPLDTVLLQPRSSIVSVIGFVTGFVDDDKFDRPEPTITRTGEWMLTINLCDNDVLMCGGGVHGVKCRFFRKDQALLPRPRRGDIMALVGMKRMEFYNEPLLLSNNNTVVYLFDQQHIPSPEDSGDKVPHVSFPRGRAPDPPILIYVLLLKHHQAAAINSTIFGSAEQPPCLEAEQTPMRPAAAAALAATNGESPYLQPPALASPIAARSHQHGSPIKTASAAVIGRKFSLIQDVQPNSFYDLLVEVVKVFPLPGGDFAQVYVTDYTAHQQLQDRLDPEGRGDLAGRDGDQYGYSSKMDKAWPGPWGRLTLCIEVYQPHLSYINEKVKPGDFVEVKNMRVKLNSSHTQLEANLWRDNRSPDKILVFKVKPADHEHGRQLLTRRDAYWADRKRPEAAPKPQGKKRRKAKQLQKAAEQAANKKLEIGVACNKNVQSSHSQVPCSTLSAMLAMRGSFKAPDGRMQDLPFVNQKRRCQVRVVDYFPADVQDFSVLKQAQQAPAADDSDEEMTDSSGAWEWDFMLLVEDASAPPSKDSAPPHTWVHVPNDAAQYLFDLDACNLACNASILNLLTLKMDILCGNLRDLKEDQNKTLAVRPVAPDVWAGKLSNLAFECCLQEYGQLVDEDDRGEAQQAGWMRMFRMFETKIL